jgi:SH3-like domain-containing protein
MNLRSVSLALALALSALGATLEAKAYTAFSFDKVDSIGAISTYEDGGKVSDNLVAQNRVATLTAQDRGAHINLRSQPTVQSRAMGYGLPGDRVDLLQCVQDNDTRGSDLNWCKVRFPVSGAVGWVRSDFIIFPSDGE